MRVLENGRQIREKCGHIVFPKDKGFWCPCQKCLDVRFFHKFFMWARDENASIHAVGGHRLATAGAHLGTAADGAWLTKATLLLTGSSVSKKKETAICFGLLG